MAAKGSFAQRMASMASTVENWDDDGDFDGSVDLFTHSMSTLQSASSRVSVRSESNTGDDDWQVLLRPNDEASTMNAITSAKQAGIPIPASVPSSALLGGAIKRLGKKKSNRKIAVDEDWGNDLELPTNAGEGLKLKAPMPRTPADDNDGFDDDWGEGSLGIRFAGTRRDGRGARSSSVSAMSPSMGSIMTLESEDDDLNGLVLPSEPLDFSARLEKLKKSEVPVPDASPFITLPKRALPPTSAPVLGPPVEFASPPAPSWASPPPFESEPAPTHEPKLMGVEEDDDFMDGLEIGGGEVLDTNKLTLNRNVKVKKPPAKITTPPAARPATTLTFTDKLEKPSMSKIPRPLSISSRTRLTPVYESGAPQNGQNGHNRPMPTTTSAQLLRAKRSAPLLRNNNHAHPARSSVPFLPAGTSTAQSHHVMAKPPSRGHLRRDSDPRRPQSPSMRSYSRMSTADAMATPSRNGMRKDTTPATVRQTQKMTLPKGRKQFGDGSELEIFDDLPTSATKEKQFEKTPRNVPSNRTLRQQNSISRLPMLDRMATPMPQTPRSPPRVDSTPRFARDTAASRNAREQRLAGLRSRGDGPIAPMQINWKVHVAAKSPHTSPTAHRKKNSRQKPHLIRGLFEPYAKTEKGMIYNPTMQRWEGNEEALAPFTHPNGSSATIDLTTVSTPTFAPLSSPFGHSHERSHSISHTALSHIQQKSISSRAVKIAPQPSPSPPRPALISQKTMPRGVQYEGRMVFDPIKMTWLKAPRETNDPRSPSVDMDDEEDPFAGLEDLKDNVSVAGHVDSGSGTAGAEDPSFIGEEFDLGPSFIRRQREEEAIWRRRTEGWVGTMRDSGEHKHGWRWELRRIAMHASEER
ncbi:hypothetical protein BU23DRAFT_574527 [Bimuria novae-zelandiae CBS 107.79]|uniref:Cytokinesis regulator n=1 Tax=Bimuria novae-zelandiae CBS 107.79 TaxID=1447943 RepID=A0A6A5UXS9_9PLEO|nr:hypothetical protein BU23DRAFT_574527 [Bimuria novae-zelandiae CBS 107.79]